MQDKLRNSLGLHQPLIDLVYTAAAGAYPDSWSNHCIVCHLVAVLEVVGNCYKQMDSMAQMMTQEHTKARSKIVLYDLQRRAVEHGAAQAGGSRIDLTSGRQGACGSNSEENSFICRRQGRHTA